MMTLKVEGPTLLVPAKTYVVCGPTCGCGRLFLVGPKECPHCGQPTNVGELRTGGAIVQLIETLFNWEYSPMLNWR